MDGSNRVSKNMDLLVASNVSIQRFEKVVCKSSEIELVS